MATGGLASRLTAKEKKQITISIMFSTFVCSTQYLSMAAFYPNYVKKTYGENISSTMIAAAVSAFEFSSMVFTAMHPMVIRKIGRKNAVTFGFIMLSLSIGA